MKFYEIKNITETSADMFVYGEICLDKDEWWGSETDVTLLDFKEELDSLGNIQTLNIYVNSPGGSVFVASTMISLLKRKKDEGVVINAYVDGLAASAASMLIMVANNIYVYNNSMLMIHPPMSSAYGNVNDMQKTIDMLNKVQEGVLTPLYLEKYKKSNEELQELINKETWFDSKESIEAFNIELIEEEKQVAAYINKDMMMRYKNIPKNLLEKIENKQIEEVKKEEKRIDPIKNDKRKELISNELKLVDSFLFIKNIKEKEGQSNE